MDIKDGDPYARWVALNQELSGQSSPTGLGASQVMLRLGIVVKLIPLTVRTAGVDLPPSALRVNERLVKGAKWRVRLTSSAARLDGLNGTMEGTVTTPTGPGMLDTVTDSQLESPETVLDRTQAEQLELDLEEGDTVLMLTEDDQIFYIIMKVARAV